MSPSEPWSVAVVGAGAIGTYYGARLALAGAAVTLLMRGDLEAVRARGSVLLHGRDCTTELRPVRVAGDAREVGPVDLVVVTLKTTANGELARLVGPLVGLDTTILTLQNGLGSDEQLAAGFGADRTSRKSREKTSTAGSFLARAAARPACASMQVTTWPHATS